MLTIVALIAPLSMLVYALKVLGSGKSSVQKLARGEFPSLIGIGSSLYVLGDIILRSSYHSPLLGLQGLGFSVRLDALSTSILVMIAILAFVILRFSYNYMDGDSRKHVFMASLAITIASVQMLILSGNLVQLTVFWIITSICLHYLLVFYRHRPQAIAAARKKFMVARIGDVSLLIAVILLYGVFGTGSLEAIFQAIKDSSVETSSLVVPTVFMVSAAFFKSAQFPTHGWLIEVVETPTPVSALLHAGLLNAGPFLMVRFSFLMHESVPGSTLLILVGGFTALFASVVYLTQPSIKVALGYSSIAHMGFSLLLSGLGVYSAAILHIVGHSFYKAHSFLSSGSVVEATQSKKIISPKRLRNPLLTLLSVGMSGGLFALCSYLIGIDVFNEFSLMIISAIIIMGMSQFLVQAYDSKGSIAVLLQTSLIAAGVAISFLVLEHGSRLLLFSEIPELHTPGGAVQVSAWVVLSCFGLVIALQLLSPNLRDTAVGYKVGVHLRNGLYANVLFDRMIGSLKHEKFKWANLTVQEEKDTLSPTASKEGNALVKRAEMLIKD